MSGLSDVLSQRRAAGTNPSLAAWFASLRRHARQKIPAMTLSTDAILSARAVRIEDEIARRGIRLRGKVERVGPCPVCGGTDRFGINTRKQAWNCRGCGVGGDVISLVQHLDRCDFVIAVRTLTGVDARQLVPELDPNRLAEVQAKTGRIEIDALANAADNFDAAMKIWSEAVPIDGTLAEAYLAARYRRVHREFDLPNGVSGDVLRFHPACPWDTMTHPCLIALVRSTTTDKPQAIIRTALRTDGTALKINGKTARMALGPIGGGAIKLTDDAEVTIGLFVGEGLETVLISMALPTWYRPAWALISSGNLASFPVLAGIECLTILVDNDRPDKHGRRAGQAAASECALRWEAAGRDVIAIIPRREGDDMADIDAA
jgi:phage/plasmid primase-like uncharacterized protein